MAGLPNLDARILPWVVGRKKRKVETKREEGRKTVALWLYITSQLI